MTGQFPCSIPIYLQVTSSRKLSQIASSPPPLPLVECTPPCTSQSTATCPSHTHHGGLVIKSCLTLCDPTNCSPLGSSVHGIFQARILEWVAISFSRGSFSPRDWTWLSCIAGDSLPAEPPGKPITLIILICNCPFAAAPTPSGLYILWECGLSLVHFYNLSTEHSTQQELSKYLGTK